MRIGRQRRTMVVVIALALGAAACATTRGTENLLTQAGFRQAPANTPQKLAHLKTLPEHRLVGRTHQGRKYYVYADLDGCRCLYVGSPQQYQTYLGLVRAKQAEEAEAVDEAREYEIENAGLQ